MGGSKGRKGEKGEVGGERIAEWGLGGGRGGGGREESGVGWSFHLLGVSRPVQLQNGGQVHAVQSHEEDKKERILNFPPFNYHSQLECQSQSASSES